VIKTPSYLIYMLIVGKMLTLFGILTKENTCGKQILKILQTKESIIYQIFSKRNLGKQLLK
jgi:hypothetical protein